MAYDGIIYDLDGTLVDLNVDWDAVASAVETVYTDAGIDPGGRHFWELRDDAADYGLHDAVEAVITERELAGVEGSRRLPRADQLQETPLPVAVCSMNSERACREALRAHGLFDLVEAVVGRDSLELHKPAPEPALAAASHLGVDPVDVLLVGDSIHDEEMADRANMTFEMV